MSKSTLISTHEAADIAGVSRRLVQRLIAEGRVPCHRIGRTAGIDKAGLRFLLSRNKKLGRPPHVDK